jgi:hypothetical protein
MQTYLRPDLAPGLVTKSGWVRGRQAAVGLHMDHLLGQALATRRGFVNLGRRVLSIFPARRHKSSRIYRFSFLMT